MAKPKTEQKTEHIGFLNADWGNRLNKQMQAGKKDTVTVMENLVLDLSPTVYESHKRRYSNRPAEFDNTHIFAIRERHKDKPIPVKNGVWYPTMVGDAAKIHGKPKAQTGEVKYRYDYFGRLACANFLSQWPDGHDYIVLHLGHPTQSIGQVDMMINNVVGIHEVMRIDGQVVRFTVREVIPWDEPNGGIVAYLSGPHGQYNPNNLDSGDEILVIDIGGGITSLTRVLVERDRANKLQLKPVYDLQMSPSFDMGIRTIMDKLAIELKQTHEDFATVKNITDKMLEEALKTNHITLRGDPVNVEQQVMNSDYQLLDALRDVYENRMDSGAQFNLIVLTGGGSKTLYSSVLPVLDHSYVVAAVPEIDDLFLANLYGADEMFRQWILRQEVKS